MIALIQLEIVMAFDHNRKDVGDIARREAFRYAERWGYTTHIVQVPEFKCPYTAKLELIRERLMRNHYIMWLDADALIVNQDFTIKPFVTISDSFPLVISRDKSGVCTGMFILKNCDWSMKLMNAWSFLGMMQDRSMFGGDQREQATLKLFIENFPHLMDKIYTINTDYVSNPNQPCSFNNPFIHHFWATNKDQDVVAEEMKRMLKCSS